MAAPVVVCALLIPASARAASNELSNPSVTPTQGTTATTFTFSVDFTSNQASAPRSVEAVVGGVRVSLAPTGLPIGGTYRGTSPLPEGTWPVTFEADALVGNDPRIAGLTVVVANAKPTPAPTQRPTSRPATPAPTPAGVTTPVPATSSPSPSPSATIAGTPGGAAFTPTPTASPTGRAAAKTTPEPRPPGVGFDSVAWLFLGGTMAGSGAAFLGVQLVMRRTRPRRLPRG